MARRLLPKSLIAILLVFDLAVAFSLLTNRKFSHLAIWKIKESSQDNVFYWSPDDAPKGYFFFPEEARLEAFRQEISPFIKNQQDDFDSVLLVAKHVYKLLREETGEKNYLYYGNPEAMLRQIRNGSTGAHCFHNAVILTSYLASIGIKSRLWALENNNFSSGSPHTVSEVYISSLKKWVFLDPFLDFYVTEQGIPLSLLELREKILQGAVITRLNFEGEKIESSLPQYKQLIVTVFLRTNNDFSSVSNNIGFALPATLVKLCNSIKLGSAYLFSRREIFVHYVDKFSGSLRKEIIVAKAIFYLFIFSSGLLLLYAVFSLLSLPIIFDRKHSKKVTRHK